MGPMTASVVNIDAGMRAASCRRCDLDGLCTALQRSVEQGARRTGAIQRGKQLFRQGEAFKGLFVVRSGSMKTCTTAADGIEQVVRFHMPGEVLGLDGLSGGIYHASATALEMASVCRISGEELDHLLNRSPAVARDLLGLAGREMVAEQARLALVGQRAADTRLATFLLGLSREFARRGYSSTEFNLSMSRQDIANYLALAVETVSRLFTQFCQAGILDVERRRVRILDLEGLRGLLSGGQNTQSVAS
jgi:CRP/FNR family transcriptional regulator, anaerobic regulatory protein